MKTATLLLAFSIALAVSGCSTTVHTTGNKNSDKPLPPGQAKKIYGTKSAKPFAPGQQKK
ncbi:hypothetical protein [Flavobacterium cerinum]|uniref:Quinol oxidase subunit 4 n=1 Tax=Flavobacterium cerinum TaxID=2502784 RepID=A0ABY5IUB0_9FLAO|nr:hypothetical protein [Flavobacterium cerinum]UUC46403.1 hypothetical protein NOX80_04170 [Flavobacterium cerinum]